MAGMLGELFHPFYSYPLRKVLRVAISSGLTSSVGFIYLIMPSLGMC